MSAETETEEPSDIDLALASYLGSPDGQATTAETGTNRAAIHAWAYGFIACLHLCNDRTEELTSELIKTLEEIDLYEG